jgi:hypothetical protein
MKPPEGDPGSGSGRVVRLDLDRDRIVWRLALVWVAIELGLLVLDYHVNFGGVHIAGSIRRLANLAREDSLANLLAVLQVFLLALTVWGVWLTERRAGASKWQRRGWAVVAFLFTWMTIDDGARVHERFGTASKRVMEAWMDARGEEFVDFFPSYAWQVVFLPFFAALGLFTLWFLWKELKPKHSRTMVMVGIACFVTAVGMDFFEGLDSGHRANPYAWLADRLDIEEWTKWRFHASTYATLRHFSKDIEEVIEMFGTTLIWLAVLRHWLGSASEMRIRFSTKQ